MFDGHRRWTLLGLLAAVNLVLWVGAGCLVGLCAGDEMDLGVETFLRHAQATAVAAFAEIRDGATARLAGEGSPLAWRVPERLTDDSGTTGPNPEGNANRAQPPSVTVAPLDPGSAADLDLPTGDSAESNGTTPPDSHVSSNGSATSTGPQQWSPRAGSEPGVAPVEPEPGVKASSALSGSEVSTAPAVAGRANVSSPLLLVDPEFHSLAALDAEMERSAPGRPVQIRYQEAALNQEIAFLWLNNPALPFRDVEVDLRHNGVAISGKMTVFGFPVEALVEGAVIARDCVPCLEVENVSVAGITTPRFVRARVVAIAQEAMAWYPADYPLCLEQIVLEETRATFYGYHR
jgi:hypothetical protein